MKVENKPWKVEVPNWQCLNISCNEAFLDEYLKKIEGAASLIAAISRFNMIKNFSFVSNCRLELERSS